MNRKRKKIVILSIILLAGTFLGCGDPETPRPTPIIAETYIHEEGQ